MEDWKKKYEDLIRDIDIAIEGQGEGETKIVLQNLKQRSMESEDERIKKLIKFTLQSYTRSVVVGTLSLKDYNDCVVWLEKQGEQKPIMIQWQGNNLKEVIDFTGKDKNFEKWFKSFEEYEKYVHEHNNIFKIFTEDGSHYEVPVGAWIIKTPDGCNIASKSFFVQKFSWSEEDDRHLSIAIQYVFQHGYLSTVDWLKVLKNRCAPQLPCIQKT